MLKVADYLENDVINTIEIISYDTLLKEQYNTDWIDCLNKKDLVIAGDEEILKAAGVIDRTTIREVHHAKLVRTILQYLYKNNKTVFVLASSEDALSYFRASLPNYVRNLNIVGTDLLEEGSGKEAIAINNINGLDADCILSILPSPIQEEFIHQHQSLLHSRLWFGCGEFFNRDLHEQSGMTRLLHYIKKKVFHYKVEKHKKHL